MNELLKILAVIEHSNENLVSKLAEPISLSIGYRLPQDLKYYLENYDSIIFFEDSACSIKIVGVSEFKNANVVIVGENVDDDISHNWFVIADDHNSQYISIDLAKERLGYCYDSFWDRHGPPGEQAIIARTFTELLERLYSTRGTNWFWLEEDFQSYGDAYDFQ